MTTIKTTCLTTPTVTPAKANATKAVYLATDVLDYFDYTIANDDHLEEEYKMSARERATAVSDPMSAYFSKEQGDERFNDWLESNGLEPRQS